MSSALRFFFDSTEYRLAVCKGIPVPELLAGIREALALPANAILRFRNADGDIAILSSYWPHESQFHVEVINENDKGVVPTLPGYFNEWAELGPLI
jgi:hypothetical protein